MKLSVLERLLEARRAGQPVALVTDLADGRQALVGPDGAAGELDLSAAEHAALEGAFAADRCVTIETGTRSLFLEVWNPPLRLVVIGGVHIAQALVPMAEAAFYRTIVVDPRQAFGSPARFPGVEIVNDWPDAALARIQPDKRTAIVALTHDAKLDDPALEAALRSPAFYIGALGSRRNHAQRCARLSEKGFAPAEIARVRGPVGLAIGAVSPAEIAISILAEMTAVLRGAAVPARG